MSLNACMQVLEAQGHSLVQPSNRRGLHPLVVPLAVHHAPEGGNGDGGESLTCLLRWPDSHSGQRVSDH